MDFVKNNGEKPFVVYWNNIPAPYMVERFNALSINNPFQFEAWFNDRTEFDRSWTVKESEWQFDYRYMNAISIAGRTLHFPLPLLKHKAPDVLVSLYAKPSFLLGWAIAKLRKIKTGFWVETTFDSWVRRTFFKEIIKKWLFPKVDFIITVGRDGENYAKRYGAKNENIFFAPHVIDVDFFRKKCNIDHSTRLKLRKNYGIKGVTFLYVGRLIEKKGLSFLLDAHKMVQQRSESQTTLLVVGDGSDEKLFKKKCRDEKIKNVMFAGFRQKDEMTEMYGLADVFVFPTLGDPYGLVVDEAMACGLPIISTSASGEIKDRIEDGVNGFIVPPENSRELAKAMFTLAGNPSLKKKMGIESAKKIKSNTPEKWAFDIERVVWKAFYNV